MAEVFTLNGLKAKAPSKDAVMRYLARKESLIKMLRERGLDTTEDEVQYAEALNIGQKVGVVWIPNI